MPAGAPVDLGVDNTSFLVDTATGGGTLVHWGAALDGDPAATAAALHWRRVPAASTSSHQCRSCPSTGRVSRAAGAQRASQ